MANENEIYPVKKLLRMTEEMAARISKRRYDSRIPSESETIRRLLTVALDTLDDAEARARPASAASRE